MNEQHNGYSTFFQSIVHVLCSEKPCCATDMNIKESTLWKAFEEVKAHPEILKDAMQETAEDLDTLWTGFQTILSVAKLATEFAEGIGARSVDVDPLVRAAAARVFEQITDEQEEKTE